MHAAVHWGQVALHENMQSNLSPVHGGVQPYPSPMHGRMDIDMVYWSTLTEKSYIIFAISRLLTGKSEFTHSRSMPTVPFAM